MPLPRALFKLWPDHAAAIMVFRRHHPSHGLHARCDGAMDGEVSVLFEKRLLCLLVGLVRRCVCSWDWFVSRRHRQAELESVTLVF